MKDAVLAMIALAAIMLYVELRLQRYSVNGVQYERVGMMKHDVGGDVVFYPVFKLKETK